MHEAVVLRNGKLIIGIDVAPEQHVLDVEAVHRLGQELVGPDDHEHSPYSKSLVKANKLGSPVSSATLVTLPVPKSGHAPVTYTLQVEGANKTTGSFLTGFYLPGDTAGTGQVTSTSLSTILSEVGSKSTSSKYTFDADSNRDGKITMADVAIASKNLGAKTTISPVVDVNLAAADSGTLNDRITEPPDRDLLRHGHARRDDHVSRGQQQLARRYGHRGRDRQLQHRRPARQRLQHLQGEYHGRVRPDHLRHDLPRDLQHDPAYGHQHAEHDLDDLTT